MRKERERKNINFNISFINIIRSSNYMQKILSLCVIMTIILVPILISEHHESNFNLGIIYVDNIPGEGPDNPPEDFISIQDAIDNALDGDTIYVYEGIYYENIIINKSINVIGEKRETTIIDGKGTDDTVWIKTSQVNFSGFTVQNATKDFWCVGIHMIEKKWWPASNPPAPLSHIHISHCIVKNNMGGIRPWNTSEISITNCSIYNNTASIYIYNSSNLSISHCFIHHNGEYIDDTTYPGGISISAGDRPEENSRSITIDNCTIHENIGTGIAIATGTKDTLVEYNTISNNDGIGLHIQNCDTIVRKNRIIGNGGNEFMDAGIYLSNACFNHIENNEITLNKPDGIFLMRSEKNVIIKNNFINNTRHAYFSLRSSFWNQWNNNYWDDWIGIGPKVIHGTVCAYLLPWVNFDWRPAIHPYNIP
jgi:nitrous oxidase accessory protein